MTSFLSIVKLETLGGSGKITDITQNKSTTLLQMEHVTPSVLFHNFGKKQSMLSKKKIDTQFVNDPNHTKTQIQCSIKTYLISGVKQRIKEIIESRKYPCPHVCVMDAQIRRQR